MSFSDKSEAYKKAHKKYSKEHYKTLGVSTDKVNAELIETAALDQHLTTSKFLFLSAMYCIKNNIDLTEFQE
ncbi:MAG: hypothetical protein NC548_59600 [Lachnospiraceae bacterium]|nr:hypothetical protein [Lachnospiraceae bacterium]MCM1233876.1 hypothetical protein [Ruminococcus flavefaciens]